MPQASTISRQAGADVTPRPRSGEPASVSVTRLAWRRRIAKATRWLHIYGSMVSLALVLFFAATGITLNHQDWFAGHEVTAERRGTMTASWLAGDVDKLAVVEFLRANAGIHGALADFRIDDQQCDVVFKGPGYAATALIERSTGRFDLTESRLGVAAIMNDLHKGRDTGRVWSVVIDLSAAVLVFISLTGLILLYFVHKYRVAGIILGGVGALASYLVYAIWVP
ncbi:MAG: PepSY-associated TM helix domain-containing protein [Vicinamibacterales bacterium]